jgi:hypothetical protein
MFRREYAAGELQFTGSRLNVSVGLTEWIE